MLPIDFGCRMGLKHVGNYVVAMVTFVAVGYQSYLQFTSLPVHMKETMLFCFYRFVKMNCYLFKFFCLCFSYI
jgi:dolichyl-phosphate-mannose--protein O-mannosyl transferase